MNGLKDMYRNIRNPANFPDLFNGVDKCKIADSAGIDNRILYIVSSDDEADCTPVSSIAAKQRYFIETICSLGEVKKSREIHIKVHPNIIGSHSYPGMEESLRFYQGLAVKYKSSSHVKIHLSPDIDPFSLVDDSKIVVGVHSTLIDYAWFSGKMIVTDRHAISRHLASTLIDFFSDEEIEAVLFGEMSEQHGKISAGRLVSGQLGYIALKDLCFDLNLGEVDISEGYFQPKNPRLSLDLKGDHQFEAAAYLVSRSLIEGQIINTLIFNHRLQSKTDSES